MASTLPTRFDGADCADNAENCGESATTAAPHTSSSTMNVCGESCFQPAATMKQQKAEVVNASAATRALPNLRLAIPPTMQPSEPTAIVANASPAMLSCGTRRCNAVAMMRGTSVQNVYNSHMCPK